MNYHRKSYCVKSPRSSGGGADAAPTGPSSSGVGGQEPERPVELEFLWYADTLDGEGATLTDADQCPRRLSEIPLEI